MLGLVIDLHFAQAGLQQILGVFAVQDGKIRLVSQGERVAAQNTGADGMKGAAPQPRQYPAQQVVDPLHHFLGRLVGEGQKQHGFRRNALFQEEGDTVSQRAGLARAGAGDDQSGARRRRHGRVLLLIQLLRIINPQMERRTEGL